MSTATDMLAQYLAAEVAVLKGTSFRLADGRQLTRSALVEIVAERKYWQRQVNAELASAAGQRGPLSVHVSDFSDGTSRGGFGDRGQFGWH